MYENYQAIKNTILEAAGETQLHTEHPSAVLHKDYSLHDLEKYSLNRNQFRGAFKTSRIDDFKTYCNNHSDSTCFVNPEAMEAQVIFDLGNGINPGHCKHTATLKLQKTAEYTLLLNLTDRTFTQRQLFDFIQDWQSNMTAVNTAGEETDLYKALQSILNVSITATARSEHQETDLSASSSNFAKIQAESSGETALPAGILFDLKPYLSLEKRYFYLRLSLNTQSEKPEFTLRAQALEEAKQEMVDEFDDLLTKEFDDLVIKGTFTP